MKKCLICNGQKHIYGMGNMREKCKACGAKGFVEEKKAQQAKPTAENAKNTKKAKKGNFDE